MSIQDVTKSITRNETFFGEIHREEEKISRSRSLDTLPSHIDQYTQVFHQDYFRINSEGKNISDETATTEEEAEEHPLSPQAMGESESQERIASSDMSKLDVDKEIEEI
jgi:uncharacterized protein YigA (DUF484 family)